MPLATASRGAGRAWSVLLAVLAGAHLALLSAALVPADLDLSYPFLDGDSHDWLANGLRLAGVDVRYSGRPPLVPLVLAGLAKAGALPLFPVFVLFLTHAAALVVFRVLARVAGRGPAAAAALLLLLDASWLRLSFDLMADVTAASLLAGAAALFLLARDEPRAYPAAGLLAGLSALAQQTALLLPLPALATLLLARRAHLRSRWAAAGAGLFALPLAAWLLLRDVAGGGGVVQWSFLLRPHLDAIPHYLVATTSFAGLPLLALATCGAASVRSGPAERDLVVTTVGTLATLGGFFVLAYDFRDVRFVAYLFPLLVVLGAAGLARIRSRAGRLAAAGAALAFALVPVWDPAREAIRVVLWPLPAVDLAWSVRRAPVGDARIDLSSVRLELRSAGDVLRATPHAVALRERVASGQVSRPDLVGLGHPASALFVHDAAGGGSRYVETNRLGNALGCRVKFVPDGWLERYGRFLRVVPLPPFDRYAPFRAVLPGGNDRHLLVATRGGAVERSLRALAARQAPAEPQPAPGSAAEAGAISARLGERDELVVVFEPRSLDATILFIPFLARSTDLFLVDAASAGETEGRLAATGEAAPVRIGRWVVRRVAVPGRRGWAVRIDGREERGRADGTGPREPLPLVAGGS